MCWVSVSRTRGKDRDSGRQPLAHLQVLVQLVLALPLVQLLVVLAPLAAGPAHCQAAGHHPAPLALLALLAGPEVLPPPLLAGQQVLPLALLVLPPPLLALLVGPPEVLLEVLLEVLGVVPRSPLAQEVVAPLPHHDHRHCHQRK